MKTILLDLYIVAYILKEEYIRIFRLFYICSY